MEAGRPLILRCVEKKSIKCLPVVLLAMAFLVTGCPHNDYVVALKPHGKSMERTLTFYRADGVDTNTGAPKYQTFDEKELATIAELYSSPVKTDSGHSYIFMVSGEFTNAMPADVGGAGSYTNLATSLGETGFYAERFRGNDDLAGMAERQFKAADKLTDLVIDWSKAELGREPGYDKLRQFLDTELRRDLKNFTAYWKEGQMAADYRTNATEEYIVRFAQYLHERGYFTMAEALALFRDGQQPLIQRLVARKLAVPDMDPIPASLAFLADDDAVAKSFEKYMEGTELYRTKVKQWEADKKTNPQAKQPTAERIYADILEEMMEFELWRTSDHLKVQLSLPGPPDHSNGHWDEKLRELIWEANIEERTNAAHLPFFCYANWAQPDEAFQTAHFGKVGLRGDELTQYCIWRSGLDAKRGGQWDAFVAELQPGRELSGMIQAFRFSNETVQPETKEAKQSAGSSDVARRLLMEAVK